jgi:hypothetical protein
VINWSIVNFYLSFLPWILTFALILKFINFHYHTPYLPKTKPEKIATILVSILLILIILAIVPILRSLVHQGEHVLLALPLREGLYVVTNGGNSLAGRGMNNHMNAWLSQELTPDPAKQYGIDIMRLNIGGNIGVNNDFIPETIQNYEGYADQVYGPCFGQVVYVEDGHPDVGVYEKGTELGNYVVLECADFYITLSNLKKNSIILKPGDQFNLNRMIAQVGNSAEPGLPHLHIHATKGGWKDGEGTPVPMLFESLFAVNDFLIRNELLLR